MIQPHVSPVNENETVPLTTSPHDIFGSYGSIHVADCSNGPADDHSGSPRQNPSLKINSTSSVFSELFVCARRKRKQKKA